MNGMKSGYRVSQRLIIVGQKVKLGVFEDRWVTENVESGFSSHGDVERTLYGFFYFLFFVAAMQ